jgi:hypothetical protein
VRLPTIGVDDRERRAIGTVSHFFWPENGGFGEGL